MSRADRRNRARWSRAQRQLAYQAFEQQLEIDRLERLEGLRQQLAAFESLAGSPLADEIIASARSEITRLEKVR